MRFWHNTSARCGRLAVDHRKRRRLVSGEISAMRRFMVPHLVAFFAALFSLPAQIIVICVHPATRPDVLADWLKWRMIWHAQAGVRQNGLKCAYRHGGNHGTL